MQKLIPLFYRAVSLVLVAAILGTPSPAQAAFLDDGWGARPVGMGSAFTAIADDTNASLYNPAGIIQVQWNEVSAMYARLFSGLTLYSGDDQVHLDQSYLAFVSKPIPRFGSWGLSWANFNTTGLYREDTVTLSYARYLGDFYEPLNNHVSMGVNLKYLRRSISLDARTAGDPVFAGGTSASAVTGDVGLLYKMDEGPMDGWRFGLAVKNLTQPDVGFSATDKVPLEYRLGVAYQNRQMPYLVPTIDFSRRDGITGVGGGVESWLFQEALGLRGGVNRDAGTAGISYYQSVTKSFGLRLDYGIAIPFYVQGTNGNHRLSMTLYF